MSLDRFKENVKEVLKGNEEILSYTDYEKVIKELYKRKLITINDTTALKENTMIFPMTVEHFVKHLADNYSLDHLKDFDLLLNRFHRQLEDCKNTLCYWKTEGFTNEELKGLLLVYDRIQTEYKEIKTEYKEIDDAIQNLSEPINRLKDQFEQNSEIKTKTAFSYIDEENFSIEKEYFNMRVRDAHYRNQPIIILKIAPSGIVHQLGYCIDKDFPIEVVKIPRNFLDFQKLEIKLHTMTALKQLIFSKYFQKFLGSNTLSDPDYLLYFFDYIKGHSMDFIFVKNNSILNQNTGLFSFWMRELFVAFKDLLEKTYYEPILPIQLKNIFVADDGLKIFIKNISFSQIRIKTDEAHFRLESDLLKNYGELLLQILGVKNPENLETNYFLDPNLQNFIEGLLASDKDLNLFLKKHISRRLCFSDLLNHPYLHEKYLIEIDVCDIANEFTRLLENPNKTKKIGFNNVF